MKFIIGIVIVFGSVALGYWMHHGKFAVLWQPNEFIIIMGAAIGAFLVGTPGAQVKDTVKSFKYLFKGMPYSKKDYTELLLMLNGTFKTMRAKGMLEIEQHIETPSDSAIFQLSPKFLQNHEAVHFFCDYLRLLTMGMEDQYQLDDMMEADLDLHRGHGAHVAHGIALLSDSLPALGIVAAVLGVITTMGSIDQPPIILGGLIGAALVGTFFGVLMSYAVFAPISTYIGAYYEAKVKFIAVIKVALLAHVKGNAPVVSVEFARNSIDEHNRPSFAEMEDALAAAPSV